MLKVKCIQKFRDKNNIIIGYRIIDQNGNMKDVSSESLKQAIKQGKLEVINLTLTSNNRLIDKALAQTPTQQTQKSIKQSSQETMDINSMLLRLKLLGCVTEIEEGCNHKTYLAKISEAEYRIIIQDQDDIGEIKSSCITEIEEGCDHTIYLTKISEEDYRLIIPDDATKIEFNYVFNRATPISRTPIESSNAKLTVYGGNNLKIAEGLFAGTKFDIIDLRKFNTSKITDMVFMFFDCQVTSIDLSSFDTSNVTDMSEMFCRCKTASLNLSNFNTSKVKYMGNMFSQCKATSIDLSSFDISNVAYMGEMFHKCKATSVNFGRNKTLELECEYWRGV